MLYISALTQGVVSSPLALQTSLLFLHFLIRCRQFGLPRSRYCTLTQLKPNPNWGPYPKNLCLFTSCLPHLFTSSRLFLPVHCSGSNRIFAHFLFCLAYWAIFSESDFLNSHRRCFLPANTVCATFSSILQMRISILREREAVWYSRSKFFLFFGVFAAKETGETISYLQEFLSFFSGKASSQVQGEEPEPGGGGERGGWQADHAHIWGSNPRRTSRPHQFLCMQFAQKKCQKENFLPNSNGLCWLFSLPFILCLEVIWILF